MTLKRAGWVHYGGKWQSSQAGACQTVLERRGSVQRVCFARSLPGHPPSAAQLLMGLILARPGPARLVGRSAHPAPTLRIASFFTILVLHAFNACRARGAVRMASWPCGVAGGRAGQRCAWQSMVAWPSGPVCFRLRISPATDWVCRPGAAARAGCIEGDPTMHASSCI